MRWIVTSCVLSTCGPRRGEVEEECFAPCVKVLGGARNHPGGLRGEVRWSFGSSRGARRRPGWPNFHFLDFAPMAVLNFRGSPPPGVASGGVLVHPGRFWATSFVVVFFAFSNFVRASNGRLPAQFWRRNVLRTSRDFPLGALRPTTI